MEIFQNSIIVTLRLKKLGNAVLSGKNFKFPTLECLLGERDVTNDLRENSSRAKEAFWNFLVFKFLNLNLSINFKPFHIRSKKRGKPVLLIYQLPSFPMSTGRTRSDQLSSIQMLKVFLIPKYKPSSSEGKCWLVKFFS